MISSCAPPYIGREVKYSQAFCKKAFGECSGRVGDFIITYSIYKDGDGYEIKGEATYLEGKNKTWQNYSGAMFTIYLIRNFVIVEELPVAGGSGGLDRKLKFHRKFKSNGFEYSTIGYSMKVRG
jgi:hypothetical protein